MSQPLKYSLHNGLAKVSGREIKDMHNENLESFYHFVFERWKEKLAKYFQARPAVDEKRESGQYL